VNLETEEVVLRTRIGFMRREILSWYAESGRLSAYVSIRQHTSAYVSIRQHLLAYASIRQHASTYVSIRQHTSVCVSMRQHASAYVSMRQHTSAYVRMRQHASAYVSLRALVRLGCCRFLFPEIWRFLSLSPPHLLRLPDD
jgi:hypothetical protein